MVDNSEIPTLRKIFIKELSGEYDNPYFIYVPKWLAKFCKTTKFSGKETFCLTLKVGILEIKALAVPKKSDVIRLSPFLIEEFGITPDTEVNILLKDNVLQIGPVIGVFTSNGQIRKTTKYTSNFRNVELANANLQANTMLYFFCIKDVDFIKNKIKGTYFNQKNQCWEKKSFPLPDVLYDRGGGALASQQEVSKYIRKQLEISALKKINPQHYFDKWITYLRLEKQINMAGYLPKTTLFKEPADIQNMLNFSNILYLKDTLGSNGRGIMRLIKMPLGDYKVSRMEDGELNEVKTASFEEVVVICRNFFKEKSVIIQAGIDLIKLNNRPIDMRATIQRNGCGNIDILPSSVRVGQEDYPVTSSKSGSSIFQFSNFFKESFGYSDAEIRELEEIVVAFLITIFKCIEKAYGTFGEIGIDYALDRTGKIWFIECNAKPGKDCLCKSFGRETITKAFLNPLEYAKYLTGFNDHKIRGESYG